MSDPARTIESFYEAFARRDHETMATCYIPDASFSDPVFPDLRGDEVRAMWHMLCDQGADLSIEFSRVEASEHVGSAHWEARYTFSPTGRLVSNRIDAMFEFEHGLIADHVDQFDLWAWARQALGPIGWLTGWSAMARDKIREAGAVQLDRFMDAHPEYKRAE
jgi:limonene-1,2-epoxide hydrolase